MLSWVRPPSALADPSPAPPAQAQALYEEGLAHYEAQRFEEARTALARSHGLDPQPQTLFAWAQAARLSGRCAEARLLFERFIDAGAPERQAAAARLAMRRCEPAAPLPPLTAPPRVSLPAWYRDAWAGVALGTGVLSAVGGAALLVSAHGLSGRAEGAATLGEAQQMRGEAERRWSWGVGLAAVGAAALTLGATRYVWISGGRDGAVLALGGPL